MITIITIAVWIFICTRVYKGISEDIGNHTFLDDMASPPDKKKKKFYQKIDWGFYGLYTFMCLIMALFASILGLVIFAITTHIFPAQEVERIDNKRIVYSLKQNQQISGSFFLGSGSIGSYECYYMGISWLSFPS